MVITNRLNLPGAFVKAVQRDKHNAENELSVTTLLKGTCEVLLTDRHWEEFQMDAVDGYNTIFGTAVHAVLEDKDDGCEHELALSTEVEGGIKVTGRIDSYNAETGEVVDYKTCSVWKVKMQDVKDWGRQLKLYAWLLSKNGRKVSTGKIVALIKDWSPREAGKDIEYPQSPVFTYGVEFTKEELEVTEKFVKWRVGEYLQQRGLPDEELKECSKEERWATDEKWAIMQEGKKKAIKLCNTEEEARQRVEEEEMFNTSRQKYYIEFRPGENRKCAAYCACKEFCKYVKSK